MSPQVIRYAAGTSGAEADARPAAMISGGIVRGNGSNRIRHYPAADVIAFGGLLGVIATLLIAAFAGHAR
jgi:hypothetical protein